MTEKQLETWLKDDLDRSTYLDENGGEDFEAVTFEEEGILTRNKGLVVRVSDGSEFQVTIVKSK